MMILDVSEIQFAIFDSNIFTQAAKLCQLMGSLGTSGPASQVSAGPERR